MVANEAKRKMREKKFHLRHAIVILLFSGWLYCTFLYSNPIERDRCDSEIPSLSSFSCSSLTRSTPKFSKAYYDVCIVGAGLSGSVIAEQYASQLGQTSLIVEKRDHIGGNCYDYVDSDTGILVNKYGAHLFHTKYPLVWRYLQQFSDWTPFEHRVLARVGDKHVPVPVNIDTINQLFGQDIKTTEEMDKWLSSEQVKYNPAPTNSEEMALSRVGHRLFKLIFEPYTQKQWAKHPRELGPEVTARIPVRNSWDDRYFDDVFQALPTQGYTAMFDRILDHHLIETRTGVDYFDVRDLLHCGKTYFTGPIDAYFAHLGWEKLEYRSLDFERQVIWDRPDYHLPAAVVNYPSLDYNMTRIVEYKHFLGQKSNHTVLFLERSKDNGEPYYPVPNDKNKALFAKYQEMASKESNVTFVGRLANYKYFNMDQSIKNALEIFDMNAPRVAVHLFFAKATGGVEALVQLATALHRWMPSRTVFSKSGNISYEHYSSIYPTLLEIPEIEEDSLRAGDIYIIPEIEKCPAHLVQKGVRVFIWLLARITSDDWRASQSDGCEFVAHNFWLKEEFGLDRSRLLLPYIGSWAVPHTPIENERREDLIIMNSHDHADSPFAAVLTEHCDANNCTIVKPSGLNQSQLLDLYARAKIIFASCMVGSERMPLEAALNGVVMMTDNCWTGSDTRDMPIPKRNVVTPETIGEALHRILANFIEEQADYDGLRSVYKHLGPDSLEEDTKRFIYELSRKAREGVQNSN